MSSATTDPSLASQITAHKPPQMSISDIRSTKMDISWEDNDSCNGKFKAGSRAVQPTPFEQRDDFKNRH